MPLVNASGQRLGVRLVRFVYFIISLRAGADTQSLMVPPRRAGRNLTGLNGHGWITMGVFVFFFFCF